MSSKVHDAIYNDKLSLGTFTEKESNRRQNFQLADVAWEVQAFCANFSHHHVMTRRMLTSAITIALQKYAGVEQTPRQKSARRTQVRIFEGECRGLSKHISSFKPNSGAFSRETEQFCVNWHKDTSMVFYPQQYLLHLDEETSLALNTKSVVGFFFLYICKFIMWHAYNIYV